MSGSGGPGAGDGGGGAAVGAAAASDGTAVSSLTLDPESTAAREARAWVSEMLEGWPEDTVERARLIVSELVTNAVLHARTEIELRCEHDAEGARFEIGDAHRGGPMPKRYVADSPTGRGMRLVAALAQSWGVARTARGKVVWFTLARAMRPVTVPAGSVGAAGPGSMTLEDLELFAAALGEPAVRSEAGIEGAAPGPDAGRPMVHVRILALPLDVYLEAEQHNDAVLRELDLIERSGRRGPQVPPRLLELASALRAFFFAATTSTRAQVEEAIRAGRDRVDLDVDVPSEGWEVLVEMSHQLDEVDQFCRDGALLTLAASPRQRHFRHWYAAQVAEQMRGLPPTPWTEEERP